jgi:amphi-Trp domain-containing protein
MKEKDSFKHQTAVNPPELARYLAALAEAAASGSLPVADGDRAFSLHPKGLIDLDIKARQKNGRVRLRLELSWAEEEAEPAFPARDGGEP